MFSAQTSTTDRGDAVTAKNPVHPGELVRANLTELGFSAAAAARALGITRQQLYNVMRAKSAVSPEMALRFEQAFGGTADMWLRMQAAYDLAQVRQKKGDLGVHRLVPSQAA